jgi:hypothetical protein
LVTGLVFVFLNFMDPFIDLYDYPFFGIYGMFCGILFALWVLADVQKGPSYMIRPGETFKAFSIITEILNDSQDFIKFIDPHIGPRTLHMLDAAPEGIKIQVLTTTHTKGEELRKMKVQVKELIRERPNKVAIHDPCILTSPRGWKIGSSTNFIGKKQTSIDPMSITMTEEMIEWFDEEWEKSYPYV